jgi:hypothetical protein
MVRQMGTDELDGNLPTTQKQDNQMWRVWGVLKLLAQALKLLRHALIRCPADLLDLGAIGRGKGHAQCPDETHWLVMTYIP